MKEINLTDKEYNKTLSNFANNYRELNAFVMTHTNYKCKLDESLANSVELTKAKQFVLFEDRSNDKQNRQLKDGPTTNIIVSKKRTFEAASAYKGKIIGVLNFANNHSVGGAPYSAFAQEECLCRTSTLYECLKKEKETFYEKHQKEYREGRLGEWGTDDLIYSPNVVVFKTDESAPKMMEEKDWFKVDVITCAAPQLPHQNYTQPFDYGLSVMARLRRVFEVAKKEGVQVLILGAWGCGAFNNPPDAVATTFKILCNEYHFDTIEFAVYCSNDDPNNNYHIFKEIIENN